MTSGSNHVVCMQIPPLEGVASHRKGAMAEQGISCCCTSENCRLTYTAESHLSSELHTISSLFPKYLVIFAGSPSHLVARQSASEFDSPFLSGGNTTLLQHGGILKRYQILTPALITSLLITFFVLVPIIMFGISALASIQSPLSNEVPKGFDAREKKVQ
jgi:hypothetical protein